MYDRLLWRVYSEGVEEDDAEEDLRLRRALLSAARDRREALAAAAHVSTVGALLRERRLREGLAIDDVAAAAGIDPDALRELEAGRLPPWRLRVESFVELLARLGLPVSLVCQLVERMDVIPPHEPLPAQARTAVTQPAEKARVVQGASARLEVHVEQSRKRSFLAGLREYMS